MQRLASFVFDYSDDSDGSVLRSIIESPKDLPDFVKTAERLSDQKRDNVPDDRFALVLLDDGHKMKKYATIDRGNTALSVLYLLKQAHLLPPDAVKIAANNLSLACQQHGLTIPENLKIAAATGFSPISGKSQKMYAKGAKPSKIQFPTAEPEKETTENPKLGDHDAANTDVDQRTNMSGTPGTNIATRANTEREKQASVQVRRQQISREQPYVDMSSWDPGSATYEAPGASTYTLLNDKYPVDTYQQTKTAEAYFVDNWKDMHPRDRHQYAVKLASRMESLSIPVPSVMERYGSDSYAADVDMYVESRRPFIASEFSPALDTLLEKRAQVSPDTFAEALAEFDNFSNLNWHWGSSIPDPWVSTFGPSKEKLAELEWSFDEQGTRISLADLEHLARNGQQAITKQFGADFAEEFAKSPKAVFTSLPKTNKLVLARMASDRNAGTGTE